MVRSRQGSSAKVLVAGIGNRLIGNDGFALLVVDLLDSVELPENVDLKDLGTAGLTVATDLGEYDLVIFIDSMEMEGEAGRLHKAEVAVEEDLEDVSELAKVILHEVGLEGLLRFAKAIGTLSQRVVLIGCKPKVMAPSLDLSLEVEKATRRTVDMIMDVLKSSRTR